MNQLDRKEMFSNQKGSEKNFFKDYRILLSSKVKESNELIIIGKKNHFENKDENKTLRLI